MTFEPFVRRQSVFAHGRQQRSINFIGHEFLQFVILGDEAHRVGAILERELQTPQSAAQKPLDQVALIFERGIGDRKPL